MPDHFDDIAVKAPEQAELAARYERICAQVGAGSAVAATTALSSWDQVRVETATWRAVTSIRFAQDTANPQARADNDAADELGPTIDALDVRVIDHVLANERLCSTLDPHLIRLWTSQRAAFAPGIEQDLAAENRIGSRFSEMQACASIDFDGQRHGLGGIGALAEAPDQTTRREAARAEWRWRAARRDEVDAVFGELVALRDSMARKVGLTDFVELGYLRMTRIGYDRHDVARFRDEVRRSVVPLVTELQQRHAARLGLDRLYFWDERAPTSRARFMPSVGPDELCGVAAAVFDKLDEGLAALFRSMCAHGFVDLDARPAKRGGAYCRGVPAHGMSFLFGNLTGSPNDVSIFTHEMGHAFQGWAARDKQLDLRGTPCDAAEVHAMSLELLSYPYMEQFFGADADRYRHEHMTHALMILPLACADDHFQHLVYETPSASAQERHAMWLEVEQMYMPWRDFGDLPLARDGGAWHRRRQIFTSPFYAIDYALAQACALGFWHRAQTDERGAVGSWVELCGRGGEAPFADLVQSAGLPSPFEEGVLADIVERAGSSLRSWTNRSSDSDHG